MPLTTQKVTYRNIGRFCKPVKEPKAPDQSHQLTGHEAGGRPVFLMGSLRRMEGWKKYYQEHGGMI